MEDLTADDLGPYVLLIIAAILYILCVFLIVWPLRRKWMVGRIFDGGDASQLELAGIRERLDVINAECRTHTFTITRAANISLRGHPVSLIYGPVLVPTLEGVNSTKSVLAIGEGDDIEWMRRFSDVFELAFAGSTSSIFWVKVPQLMRLTNR